MGTLLSIRDYVYLAAIAIVAGGLAYWHHMAVLDGEAKIEAKNAAIAEAQQVHDTEVEIRAKTLTDKAVADFAAAHAVPVVPAATPIVCYHASPREMPSNAGPAGAGNGKTDIPAEATGPPYDPAAAVLADGRDADAQVALLQALIKSYQAAGVVAK